MLSIISNWLTNLFKENNSKNYGAPIAMNTRTVAITILAALPVAFLINVVAKSLYAIANRHQESYNVISESIKEEDGIEIQCVVCLCKVSNGEKYWILKRCNHGFHVKCIDSWLQENSSCPTCRNPIQYYKVQLQSQCRTNVFVFHFLAILKCFTTWCLDLVSQPLGDGHYFLE
ncbi:hypothetical protein LIER_08926 [Lithospermum erythrorhizon]|uniref:RING-type domain-containing protein n=1 Tax=Lithospermum erythrorhizon TaxID=34254 RepID=A0AAV3PDV9_LITER